MAGTFIVGETKIRPGVYHRRFEPPKPSKHYVTTYICDARLGFKPHTEVFAFPYPLSGISPDISTTGGISEIDVRARTFWGVTSFCYPLCGDQSD